MGLENVKKEIIREAEKKAKEINAEYAGKIDSLTAKSTEEISEYRANAEQHANQLIHTTERKMLAAARFDAQRNVLDAKKVALDSVLDSVTDHFVNMKSAEKKKFLQKLLKSAKDEIDVKVVHLNKHDVKLLTGVTTKPADIAGGLIAESKDGSVSINLSVEELVAAAREKLLVELSEVLFGNV